jgi:hypothetical protein
MLIRAPWDRDPHAATTRIGPDRSRAVAFVANYAPGTNPRASSATTFHFALFHQRLEHRCFMLLPRCHQYDHQLALSFGTNVDFGRESAAAPA